MISLAHLRTLVVLIGWLTLLSGAGQMVTPGFVLSTLSAEVSAATQHFFAIVGMFMVLFGGLMVHAARLPDAAARPALLWCALQKLGACGAVGLGVVNGVFSPLALGVAGFDLVSALLVFAFRRRLHG